MEHFDRANALAFQYFNEGRRIDHDVTRTTNDCLMDLYSKEFLAEQRVRGSSSETPIFIVGMIRTGTTLTDQIVSSHPGGRVGRRTAFLETRRDPCHPCMAQ